MKQCNNCQINKYEDDFYQVNKRNKPTIYHICKQCCSQQKKQMNEYYRDWELKKKYGISIDTYKNECLKRNNICDICFNQVKTLHVDHCHITNKVRGYLCGSCNRGIGLLKDSSTILKQAIKYLERIK